MNIRDATYDDIEHLLKLDYTYFPKEWHVEANFTEAVMAKNRYCYRLIETKEGVKGYYLIIPLKKDVFEALMDGVISEEEMVAHVQPPETERDLCLYMGSMVIDIKDPRYLSYFRSLIADFFQLIYHYQKRSINMQKVGAIAVTTKGKRLCEKLGFQFFNQEGTSTIYNVSSEELLMKNERHYTQKLK